MPASEEIKNQTEQMKVLIDTIKELGVSIGGLRGAEDKDKTTSKALADAKRKLSEEIQESGVATESARKAYIKARQDVAKFENEIKKLDKSYDKLIAHNKMLIEKTTLFSNRIKTFTGGIRTATEHFAKFAGAASFTGFSLHALADTALKYNKTMYDLSRIQGVVGRGFNDVGTSLSYIREKTKMSEMQFITLADSIMGSFVGIKPTMTDLAKTIGTIGEQFGYNYDKIKEVADLQATFPQLYDEIEKGLAAIRDGNIDAANAAKTNALAMNQASGGGQKGLDLISQALTEQTDAQKSYADILKTRADAEKELSDLQLQVSKQLTPVLKEGLEMATSLVKIFNEWKGALLTIGVVFGSLQGLMVFTKAISSARELLVSWGLIPVTAQAATIATGELTVATVAAGEASTVAGNAARAAWMKVLGPLAIVAMAVEGLGILLNKQADKKLDVAVKRSKEEHRVNITKRYKVQIESDTKGFNKEQKDRYEKSLASAEKSSIASGGKGFEDIETHLKAHSQAVQEIKNDATGVYAEWEKINVATKMQLSILEGIGSGLGTMAGTMEEAGGTAQEMLEALNKVQSLELGQMGKAFSGAMATAVQSLTDLRIPVKLDVTGNVADQMNQLKDVASQLDNINLDEDKREKITNAITTAIQKGSDLYKQQGSIAKTAFSAIESKMRQMEQFTSAYESKLDTERQLMEAAQFGMGASVDMMQKQVNLAYKMQQTYADTDKELQKHLVDKGMANAQDIEALKNAQTQADAENYIKNVMKAQGTEALELLRYATAHQEITKKIMDQQLKVYELTKSIREGYLDAIREMSVGAGEFEKIIGTQEMGVTQLMDAVKGVTGVAKLNTMALGGLQEKVLTSQGVGTEITGGYGVGGLHFIGNRQQNERNERIYKYGESVKETKRAMRGEAGVGGNVGSGVVPGVEKYTAPDRDAQIMGDEAYDGTYNGTKDALMKVGPAAFSRAMGINYGVTTGNTPGRENSSLMGGAPAANAMAVPYLNQYSGSRANGGFVPGIGIMPQAEEMVQTWTEAYAIAKKEITKRVKQKEKSVLDSADKSIHGVDKFLSEHDVTKGVFVPSFIPSRRKAGIKDKKYFKQNYGTGIFKGGIKQQEGLTGTGFEEPEIKGVYGMGQGVFKGGFRQESAWIKSQREDREKKLQKYTQEETKKRLSSTVNPGQIYDIKEGDTSREIKRMAEERLVKEEKALKTSRRGATGAVQKTDEMSAMASQFRLAAGTVKGKTPEQQTAAVRAKITSMGATEAGVWGQSGADFGKMMEAREKASPMTLAAAQKQQEIKAAMEGVGTVDTSGKASAEQKNAPQASAQRQADFLASQSQQQASYGAGGGGASGVIIIKLDPGLQAKVENAYGVILEVEQASSK
jgi:hypothetical protein